MKSYEQRFMKQARFEPGELESKIFSAYLNSTDERVNEIQKLLSVIARLPRRERFLDIQARTGEITLPLSRMFKYSLAFESNPFLVKQLQEKASGVEVSKEPFMTAKLKPGSFDFILCSHALNNLPPKNWMALVQHAYSLLREGGKLAIVIESPEGDLARFFENFTGNLINVFPLWGKIVQKYGEKALQADYFSSQIRTKSLYDIIAVGLYYLDNKKFHKLRGEIASYFAEHHQSPIGYTASQDELLITLTKSSES